MKDGDGGRLRDRPVGVRSLAHPANIAVAKNATVRRFVPLEIIDIGLVGDCFVMRPLVDVGRARIGVRGGLVGVIDVALLGLEFGGEFARMPRQIDVKMLPATAGASTNNAIVPPTPRIPTSQKTMPATLVIRRVSQS
jgi:hypothetical protein